MKFPHPGYREKLRRRGVAFLLFLLWAPPQEAGGVTCLTAEPLFDISSGGEMSLRQPADLAIHDGRLFVLDDLNGRVASFSLGGSYLSSIKLPGGGGSSYLGLDLGGDDNLYLAASEAGKIIVVNQKGGRVREFSTGDGRDSEPVGVKVFRGQCLVVDNEEHRIKIFDLEGTVLEQWGELGNGPRRFRYPFRLVQDDLGRIIVTDTLNSMIKIFTPKGEPLIEFGTFGVTEGTLYRPAGLELWEGDLLLVADHYLGSVQLFDLRGQYRAVICGKDGRPMIFRSPVSLAADDSTLFVLEMGAGRVRALRLRR